MDSLTDRDIQNMSNEKLRELWSRKPRFSTGETWLMVAREIRYRRTHGIWPYAE